MNATTVMRLACGAAALVCVAAGHAYGQTADAPLSLPQLEQLAMKNHPALAQAQAAIDAARGRARQAGALPNPILGYSGDELQTNPDGPRGTHGVFVEQTIPLGGKLALGRAVFEGDVARAEAVAALQRQRVLNGVRGAFFGALAAARRVEVRERLAQLSGEAVTVTQQLYNVGAADRPDVLESEIEAHRARLGVEEARNIWFRSWRHLAAAIGTTDLAPRALAGDLDGGLPELERERLRAAVLEQSPELLAARAGITRAEAAVGRARRMTFPDLFVNAGPGFNRERQEGHPDRATGWEWSIEAGLSLPLFNRNRGGVAASAAELSQARSEVSRLRLDLERRLAGQFDRYLTTLRKVEVYRTEILPRAEEAYRLYLTKYREMAAAYPQVLIAQRTLGQVTQEYVDALESTWRVAVGLQGFLAGDLAGGAGLAATQDEDTVSTGVRHE